jgi:FtsP/CotA-like multicopper oxidase with cupredoxin domain
MSRQERSVLGWGAFAVAIAALVLALFGLRDSGSAESGTNGGSEATVVEIALSEFAITPATPSIPSGKVILRITNKGSMVHNLSLPSLGKKTTDLQPGATEELNLGTVADGAYDMLCEIAGHAASGMTGKVTIGGSGGDMAGGMTGGMTGEGTMTWQQMDKLMLDVAMKFPAKTEGKGGTLLEPTVLADGTKQYDITAEIVDWEVEPGKLVKAWTYNGVVPAPEIRVNVGDKVKVVLTNNLPESTDIHFHGIRVPNQMDGVDPYNQKAVEPGETFVYEFEALEPAVGIYHSHHNAQAQVPNGMFGGFFIGEMPIPDYLQEKGYTQVDKQVTMVLNDAGTIGLSLNGKSFPATEPYTLRKGQVMEVTYLNEGLMAHPMHLHQPVGWIIAKDGVPLDFPMPGDTINIAPGERYTVLYKAVDQGVWAWHCHILNHAEGPTGMFGMVTALIVEQ